MTTRRMIRKAIYWSRAFRETACIGILCFLAAACATHPSAPPEPPTKVVTVQTPVPVSCVPAIPKRPDFTDTRSALLSAPNFAVRDQLVKGNWALHQSYEAELEGILNACSNAGSPSSP